MFCSKCGADLPDESEFCLKCGTPLAAGKPQAAPAREEEDKKDRTGGFWHSGAAVALIVILGLALIAGIVFGIIYLTRDSAGSDDEIDDATVEVWEEYYSLLEEDSDNIPDLTLDTASLQKSQEELQKQRERIAALEKVLANTGGSEARRAGEKSTSTRDIKADQLAASLAAYKAYIKKMEELFAALNGADLSDPNTVDKINQIIADLNRLGLKVMDTAEEFLAGNTQVVVTDFGPPILTFGESASAKLQELIAAAGGSSTLTVAIIAGSYSNPEGTINLFSDGSYETISANGATTNGTYTVSGNTITFVGSDGGVGTGIIENGVITNEYGSFTRS